MNKDAFVTQLSFHFSPASAHIVPLQTIRQRLRGIWDTLTWPVTKRILKADLALAIMFGLLFVEPLRKYTDFGLILGQVAVEFIHPTKSYGSVGEDIAFGAVMCTISSGWSLLGTFCASLVRDPLNPEMAQPKVAGILVSFLLVGAFCLNYCRVKVEQANVGGMLSATILVISLTTAITDRQWQPWHVLQNLISILCALVIVFIICILVWPENSTKIYVQKLVKTLETFDGIARRQVDGFLHINVIPREQYIYPSRTQHIQPPEPLCTVHKSIDQQLLMLVEAKRVVRREASYNYVAPRDVSDMTRLVKKMRVPLQGVSVCRTMEENMRKAQTRRHVANRLKKFAKQDSLDPIKNPLQDQGRMSYSGQSFTTMGSDNAANDSGDDAPCWDNDDITPSGSDSSSGEEDDDDMTTHDDDDDDDDDNQQQQQKQKHKGFYNNHTQSKNDISQQPHHPYHNEKQPIKTTSILMNNSSDIPHRPSTSTAATLHGGSGGNNSTDEKYNHEEDGLGGIDIHDNEDGGIAGCGIGICDGHPTLDPQHITINVPEDEATFTGSTWRREYDELLKTIRPIYNELSQACSVAVYATTRRLYRMQHIDPRYQNKPFIYRLFASHINPAYCHDEETTSIDPSEPLLAAIKKFDAHRLTGLERLYHFDAEKPIPRRILFMLLHFQFNLRGYAERVYTLSSLIYEMDKQRTRRRIWLPNVSIRKWFSKRGLEADIGLDPPATIVESQHPSTGLQRSLSRRTTTILHTMTTKEEATTTENGADSSDITTNTPPHPSDSPVRHVPREDEDSDDSEDEDECDDEYNEYDQYVEERQAQRERHLQRRRLQGGRMALPTRGQLSRPRKRNNNNKRTSSVNMDSEGLDPTMYHDPDVAYPTTRTQRLFYQGWMFLKRFLYTADTVFALRACVVVMALSLPAFIEESIDWYMRARGQWAPVVALVWMGPSVGSNFFGLMVRGIGTVLGAICALLIWEISRQNYAAMVILMFIFDLPWWLMYLNGKFWKATGLFALITTTIILGYEHNYQMSGRDISVYEVTYERTISCLAGVVGAVVVSLFPYPRTGRVELRHRISRTLGDAAALYSSFLALLLKNGYHDRAIRMSNRKVFQKVAAGIRKQIKGQRVLLEQSRFEPALRGVFQEDKYIQILQVLDNIVNLMIEMENALERIHERWRIDLVRDTWKERKNAISSFLTALYLGANALSNKTPLPPYVLRPTRARRMLTNKARLIPNLQPERLTDPEYTYYSAYLMCSEQLAVEIELLISTIRDLVGPDSVSVWLDYRH
ncbi:hypothetical protein BDA99DRAFT_495652 [Phascolomyces articulosus]|uniref:DUF2421 domain-containing protein n=1 Tax=Phascolomyces articulosus TaxID=60185 RepID=A0AAD5K9C4_9FUNG|nr:hypothetical protein BDA99DRAFT_495652 [Phascolomyces articulosus]